MTLAILVALALPGAAQAAATKPEVTTKSASNVDITTANLNGAVVPNGAQTTYSFQIGTTSLYGVTTPPVAVGNGTKAVNVTYGAAGLAPATTYHYRIVATNSKGVARGEDRTFKTRRQPLGLALSAAANPIAYNATTVLSGQLTGTGNASQPVVLQANAYPYLNGFVNVGNTVLTNADGTFAFPLTPSIVNTQYRVLMPEKSSVISPVVLLEVKVRVHTKAKPRRVKRGRRVRFSGTISPAADGMPVLIQKLVGGQWVEVARTVARDNGEGPSTFRRRVKVRRGGSYRVWVGASGPYTANIGRTIRIHSFR